MADVLISPELRAVLELHPALHERFRHLEEQNSPIALIFELLEELAEQELARTESRPMHFVSDYERFNP